MKDQMPRIYYIGTSKRGRPTIIIHRKPSEIPFSLDLELLSLAGMGDMDGPNNRVTYEFLIPEKLSRGEEVLKGAMWKRSEANPARGKEQ